MTRYGRMARHWAAAGIVALAAACDDSRRGVDAPPPPPLAELEGVAELPYAEPARVQYYEPERAYPYAERAYGMQRAFYDAPPDYGFYYDDLSPYVWETSDDWALYAEPWESDYRYYYYEPGAAYPYFVRDRDYGYAFSAAGLLIAMFYPDGRYAPVDVVYRYAPVAGRYYARGHDLRRVGQRTEHFRVDNSVWVADAPRVTRSADPWLRAARDDRRWRAWRERDGDRELRRFAVETRRRQDTAGAWREQAARHEAATMERREDRREAVQDTRRAEGDRRQMEQRQVQAERRQAQAVEQRGRDRAELQRQAETASMRERQQRQAQGEARRVEQAQRRQAEVQQQGEARRAEQAQRQQAAVQQRRQVQAERPARREPPQQARAPSAGERGRPTATREDGGKDRGRDKERKD